MTKKQQKNSTQNLPVQQEAEKKDVNQESKKKKSIVKPLIFFRSVSDRDRSFRGKGKTFFSHEKPNVGSGITAEGQRAVIRQLVEHWSVPATDFFDCPVDFHAPWYILTVDIKIHGRRRSWTRLKFSRPAGRRQ